MDVHFNFINLSKEVSGQILEVLPSAKEKDFDISVLDY